VKRSLTAALAAALLTSGLLAGCSHPFHAGAAAVVGNERIPTSQLRTMVDRGLAGVSADSTSAPARADLERLDLTELIQLSILKHMAKDMKLPEITDAQIDAEVTSAAGSSTIEELQANAASQGVDKASLRTFAAVVAYEKAIITALPTAPDKLQSAYDSAKASNFEQVHVAHILVADKATADSINAQLKADPSRFAALAAQYSTDTGNKNNGGDLGFVSRSGLDTSFAAAAFAGADGTIVGPVQSQFGYHLIKVIAHKTVSLADATPDLKLSLNGQAFVAAQQDAVKELSISVNPRFGKWVADGGSDGLGDVEASDDGSLSSPVPTASAAPQKTPTAAATVTSTPAASATAR